MHQVWILNPKESVPQSCPLAVFSDLQRVRLIMTQQDCPSHCAPVSPRNPPRGPPGGYWNPSRNASWNTFVTHTLYMFKHFKNWQLPQRLTRGPQAFIPNLSCSLDDSLGLIVIDLQMFCCTWLPNSGLDHTWPGVWWYLSDYLLHTVWDSD